MLTKVSGPVGLSDSGTNLSPSGVAGIDQSHHFSVGDLVQICSDMERMKVRFTQNTFISVIKHHKDILLVTFKVIQTIRNH